MTRASLREYAAVQRLRYQQATRAEKHQLLDEIVAVRINSKLQLPKQGS